MWRRGVTVVAELKRQFDGEGEEIAAKCDRENDKENEYEEQGAA